MPENSPSTDGRPVDAQLRGSSGSFPVSRRSSSRSWALLADSSARPAVEMWLHQTLASSAERAARRSGGSPHLKSNLKTSFICASNLPILKAFWMSASTTNLTEQLSNRTTPSRSVEWLSSERRMTKRLPLRRHQCSANASINLGVNENRATYHSHAWKMSLVSVWLEEYLQMWSSTELKWVRVPLNWIFKK